jgi:hypothetical protein
MFGLFNRKQPQVDRATVEWNTSGDGVYTVTVDGVAEAAQFTELQSEGAREFDQVGEVRILMDLRKFKGWSVPPKDDNLEFLLKYDPKIKKIAIVAEEPMRDRAEMFFGKGFRQAEVEFFPSTQFEQAKAWVAT